MKTARIPFYLLIGFNVLTWIVYLSNPFIDLRSNNHVLAQVYVALNIVFLYVGFKNGEKSGKYLRMRKTVSASSFVARYLTLYFVFYILTFPLKYAYELRCPAFDLPALINRIAIGIASPDLGYQLTLQSALSLPWSIYTIINIFDSAFFIVGMLCWKQMRAWQRYVFVVLAIIDILKWFGAGTSFGIIQMATTLVLVYCISLNNEYLPEKRIVSIIAAVFVVFIAAIVAFGINMQGRAGGTFTDLTSTKVNLDSFVYVYFISYLPKWFQNLYQYVAFYLTDGYYNLELAFDCDFDWCYFLGSTNATTGIADNIFGLGIEARNYPTKLFQQFDVDPYVYWHSCYTWIANDISFYLVPLVVYWIGNTASKALEFFRKYNDMISGILFIILANTIFFLFANNNYLSGHFYAFLFVLILWYNRKYKVSCK